MVRISFKNLDRSEIVREAVQSRVDLLVEKFPDLERSRIKVTLEMENSPFQAGPDQFRVKLHVSTGRYDGVTVEKTAPNLYVALSDVADHMLEILNRLGDKRRVRERRNARQVA